LRRYDKNSPAHASLTASVVIPYAGDWSVSVTQGTHQAVNFLGSPRLITVVAAASDPALCTASVSSNLEVGSLLTASISTFDKHGNPTNDPSDLLTYWLNDDPTPALLDGNTVSAQVDVPGLQLLHVTVNGVEIGGSPYVRQRRKHRRAANFLHPHPILSTQVLFCGHRRPCVPARLHARGQQLHALRKRLREAGCDERAVQCVRVLRNGLSRH
jgi:hypothetical protein